MQSNTSTSTGMRTPPFRPVHRRQRSAHANDVQDANAAGRPFAFVPRRRPSSEDKVHLRGENTIQAPNSAYSQVSLQEQPAPASPSTPRAFVTFPRAKSEVTHGHLPDFDNESVTPDSPASDASTPMPTPMPKNTLRLDLDNIARTYAASAAASTQVEAAASVAIACTLPHAYPASAGPTGAFSSVLIRKKSGEPLKSSLKPATWSGASRTRTKSAPSTPIGPKYVHFDAQLEHVKLFLAEQKPLAVSRDGSPTETSEGETNEGYPFPILGQLRIKPIALPLQLGESWVFDVRLETVVLEDSALKGHVLVRNVAFAKRVAARFTLDAWQTTSEVAARHVASLREGAFDRFEFRVRLSDYLGGIEAKRLVLCVRYSVEGQEMWDNNAGRNYEIGFERVKVEPLKKASAVVVDTTPTSALASISQWDVHRAGLDSMIDLRKQLEKVVKDGHDAPPPLSAALHRSRARGLRVWVGNRDLGDEQASPPPLTRSRSSSPLNAKDAQPLSARYDFSASLKSPAWTPPPGLIPASSTATPVSTSKPKSGSAANTKPKTTCPRSRSPPAAPSSPPLLPFPSTSEHRRSMTIPVDAFSPRAPRPRGSPRDSAEYVDEGAKELHRLHHNEEDRPRHHTRAWNHHASYFDRVAEDAPALRNTPPGTPTANAKYRLDISNSSSGSTSTFSSRSPSLSPGGSNFSALDAVWGVLQGESIASTPSITTSASSPTMSPLSPPEYLPRAVSDECLVVNTITGMSREKRPPVDSTPYHSFLDQFCFFTGVNAHHTDSLAPRRAHSASSVEDYFATSPPLNDGTYSHSSHAALRITPSGHTTPTRSPIPADFISNRGLTTPRLGTPNEFPPSPISTSVVG